MSRAARGAARHRGWAPAARRGGALLVATALAGCAAAGDHGGAGGPAPLRVTADAGGLEPTVATALPIGGGRVYTVAHVLDGARSVQVAGRRARVLRVDRRLDLAELAVPGLHAGPARTARADAAVRISVLRGGRARTLHARVLRRTSVAMTAQGVRVAGRPALELAATVLPGDSGAPVTDARGRLVGVVFARATGKPTAWAVALDPS